ncbi:hypothetical protein ES708_05350 [subsurface metagenome]
MAGAFGEELWENITQKKHPFPYISNLYLQLLI